MKYRPWKIVHPNGFPWTRHEIDNFVRDKYREAYDDELFIEQISVQSVALTQSDELVIIDNYWNAHPGTSDMIVVDE